MFTEEAEKWAHGKPIELLDMMDLWKLKEAAQIGDLQECASGGDNRLLRAGDTCPRCNDGVLKRRTSRRGPLLGCSNYAKTGCNFMLDLGPSVTPPQT